MICVDCKLVTVLTNSVDIPAAIFAGWQQQDIDVRHDQPTPGASCRNLDQSQVCNKSELALRFRFQWDVTDKHGRFTILISERRRSRQG